MKQVRTSIPAHLHSAFFEVGRQLNTTDPGIINTHILSCYFTGDRSDSPKQTTKQAESFDFEDLNDWTSTDETG